MRKLVLIDGHAILHRAYHALPPVMTNKEGAQTNAVYGFTTMLLKVLADLKPDYLAVAFDVSATTFRQQAYVAYQGRRPEMESALSDQIPLLHGLLEALKVPHFEVAGYEADDCIGTLARQAVEMEGGKGGKVEVIIVTGDRDMLQLVGPETKVYVPVKGLSETKTYDEGLVMSEFGVKPTQWVDVKALKGDPSDNYPGVSGIGLKTAQSLIAKYGSLEELYKHLPDLDEKTAKKLAEGVEAAGMGKKLATIVNDVPVHLSLEKARVDRIDWTSGVKYMRERLGFRTIVERVTKSYINHESDNGDTSNKSHRSNRKSTAVGDGNSEGQMKLV